MTRPPTAWLAAAGLILAAAGAAAQTPARSGQVLDPSAPFQCWWRSATGAIRLGEIVEVSLTCAVLERDDVRAVPDQSRLTVAAIQMAPFEIVGGSDPPTCDRAIGGSSNAATRSASSTPTSSAAT